MTAGSQAKFHLGVVILAAGRSERMGRPKLLLPWASTTVLGHLVEQWRRLEAWQIAVVCAARNEALDSELDRLSIPRSDRIINPNPGRGMFSSIQCAGSWPGWKPELTHWVITLGDQPHLRLETLQLLLDFAATHPDKICQPLRNGQRRHPVLLPHRVFTTLKTTPVSNLKQFLEQDRDKSAGFESEDAGLDFDMDTPADYERARQSQHGEG